MSLNDFNPDDNRDVSPEEQDVRSKSPLHEAVHNLFQDLAEAEDESMDVIDGELYCDYDEMVEHIVFMVGTAAAED
jgi:hypothetical protein